jgi:hypothetical protein
MSGRRFVLLAALAGLGVSLWLTHPLAVHPATTALDDGTLDAFQFIWNVWWVCESLVRLHTNPFFTHYLFYPQGISLVFHTLSASLGFVSIPFQLVLPGGAVTAHNLLVVAAPALLVVTVGLLAREVTGDAWAALVAGVGATITCAMVWFLPVIYLTCTYLAAALLWAWLRMHRRQRPIDLLLVFLVTGLLVFACQEYAMMVLGLLALDSLGRLLALRALALGSRWTAGLVIFWGLGAVCLGGLALVASGSPARPPPVTHLILGSGYGRGFVTPPWWTAPLLPFWSVLYLGTAPLLLAALACWSRRREALFWAGALTIVLLMACGPYLGFEHPMSGAADHTRDLAIDHVPAGRIPGPYYLALQVVPLLRFFRAPYRWIAVAQIVLAVLAAIGVAGLRRRLAPHPRALVTATALLAVIGLGLVDVRGLRAPVVAATLPDGYAVVRDDPEPSAVLELPSGLARTRFANLASRYMFYQTVHGKYLLDGTVSRLPPGLQPLFTRRFPTFADQPWIKYVVIHRDLFGDAFPASLEQVRAVERVLATEGQLVVHDGPLEIYRLHTFRPETARRVGRLAPDPLPTHGAARVSRRG